MKGHVGAALLLTLACGSGSPARPTVQVAIPPGATLSATADTLVAHGVLKSPRFFRWYARLLGKADEIKAGVYEISEGASVPRLVRTVTSGRTALRKLVVPEGLMVAEIAVTVSQQVGVPLEEFLAASRDPALIARVQARGLSLEGYLFPSTHLVRYGATAQEIVQQMVTEFEAHWRPEWNARLDSLKLTRHQLVTLASIVEGEVRYAPDRPFVASVYYNRLRRGMRLQADPTVIYALGRRRRLFEKDYLYRSPYNTYLIDGLPPGPIGQPSEESIQATLYPAYSGFLFFVAQPDGKHVFSRTLSEHLAAIRAVRDASRGLRPPPRG
ncbi:MAG: endolytic transglycosylase MltG [Gemmatimonadetes bacterium]|nr:endolytic transglycosylase MltG [Gemmatimonadota bacterium]